MQIPHRRNLALLGALAGILGPQSDQSRPVATKRPDKQGCRNGKPFNDGYDDVRLARAKAKRQRKAQRV